MKSDFQAGVDKIYNACKTYGSTPSASTPAACETSIKTIYTDRYNSGYSAGNSAGYSSGYSAGVTDGKAAGTITVAGSSGWGSVPYRDDLSQNCGYSVASDGKSASIWVNGYNCSSYSWTVTLT
jgi:hypothetical protein